MGLLVNVYIIKREESFEKKFYLPLLAAICNGLLNLFVIYLATSALSPSLIYPVIAVGALAITTIFSKFIFREQMHWWQWVGVLIGGIAVGILSI